MLEKIHATQQNLGSRIGGDGQGLGPFALVGDAIQGLMNITSIISSIIGVMTITAGIWFLFNFLVGGLQWLGAGGDKHSLEQAQKRITNAFMGLIIVVSGFTILSLTSVFLGFDFLITNPQEVITNLFPGGSQ
jgi:hypothetical protein